MTTENAIKFACKKESELFDTLKEHREYEGGVDIPRIRDSFQRDYARILYSSSFRRLQGKMQLFEVDPNKFNRNRLTHSLEVAQIARSIAAGLKMENTVAVELAALAHDIGNPPFGHSGEKRLNKLSAHIGGYEGNAQALRILRTLEKKHPQYNGLNLTYRSLLSIIKYPHKKTDENKKFLYDDDYLFYKNLIKSYNLNLKEGERTIDAQIMDLADEIAYAAHDLEDALSRNIVNVDDIYYEFKISHEYNSASETFYEITEKSKERALKSATLKSSEEFSIIYKKELLSNIVNLLCEDIDVVENEKGFSELGYGTHGLLAEGLKKLLFKVIMRKRDILIYEMKGNEILSDLYDFYKKGDNVNFLSPELRFSLPQSNDDTYISKKERAIIDYMAGMMDNFAITEWKAHCVK